jgi:hypothetical protein
MKESNKENNQADNPAPFFKLEPLSDRYRVCPYCKTAHMVKHLGRDYCTDKCADNHYNEKRRLKKQVESMLSGKIVTMYEGWDTSTEEQLELEELKNKVIQNNVKILNSLDIEDDGNNLYKIPNIESVGLDFNHYSVLMKNDMVLGHNISFYILMENYKIERVTKEEVRITRTISFTN